jgi:hypothetical protein
MSNTICPKCDSSRLKVLRPYKVINEPAVVRRRECITCGHRWYTYQELAIEREVQGYQLRWHRRHPIHGHSVEQLHIAESLQQLLASCDSDDYYEEDAIEYLWMKGVRLGSHSRRFIYTEAWNYGWRPSLRPSKLEV